MGLVLTVGGVGIAASAIVEAIDGGPEWSTLAAAAVVVGVPGALLWRFTKPAGQLVPSLIFASVAMSWIALSIAGTLPYLATGTLTRIDDALFESVAGFTTTGATVLRPIEIHGAGILFWRSMTQWFGGMGVIIIAVAVLPFLGVGGLGLLQAESPGPSSERLVPRVRETARRLYTLYLGFSATVVILYALAGMSLYDAVTHMFTTVSTGGFSPYNRSIAHFDSPAIEWIAIAAMFVAGGNFALYWRALRGRFGPLLASSEVRAYGLIVFSIAVATTLWNGASEGFEHDVVRGSVFSVVSIASTTGYTTVDFAQWAAAGQLLLIFIMGLGGMTGSTAGGLKVFRLLAILGYARRQAFAQLHPRSVRVVRMGKQVVSEDILNRTIGFFGLFMAIGAAATFVVAAFGADIVTSISAAAASIGNVGPGLGDVGPTGDYLNISAPGRAALMAAMLIGRLEIFPVLLGGIAAYRAVRRRLDLAPLRRVLRRAR